MHCGVYTVSLTLCCTSHTAFSNITMNVHLFTQWAQWEPYLPISIFFAASVIIIIGIGVFLWDYHAKFPFNGNNRKRDAIKNWIWDYKEILVVYYRCRYSRYTTQQMWIYQCQNTSISLSLSLSLPLSLIEILYVCVYACLIHRDRSSPFIIGGKTTQ